MWQWIIYIVSNALMLAYHAGTLATSVIGMLAKALMGAQLLASLSLNLSTSLPLPCQSAATEEYQS